MYCLALPLTVSDLVPEVMVGALPQPAEVARLARTERVLGEVSSGDVGALRTVLALRSRAPSRDERCIFLGRGRPVRTVRWWFGLV